MTKIFKRQYFLPWREGYDIETIKAALQKLSPNNGTGLRDLVRIRTGYQHGWRNQPRVVIFSTFFCRENVIVYIQPEIDALWPAPLAAPCLMPKHW